MSAPAGRESLSSTAYKPLKKDHFDFSGAETGAGVGEYGSEGCARRLSLERGRRCDMRSLLAFMFALPTEMTSSQAWNQQAADEIVRACDYRHYCKRHAKNALHERRFQLVTRFFISNGIPGKHHLGF
jgi:hypothetical protein